MKLKIKKDDRVTVIAGRDKGSSGKVLRVMPEKQTALVEKVNMIKRHTKPGANKDRSGRHRRKGSPGACEQSADLVSQVHRAHQSGNQASGRRQPRSLLP